MELCLALALGLALCPGPTDAACKEAKVVADVDGDTIKVEIAGQVETLRIACIDTPETHKPGTPVEPFGPEASAYTAAAAVGQTVCIEPDPQQRDRDRYGRLLGYVVMPDGSDLGARIISRGLGVTWHRGKCDRAEAYDAIEAEARRAAVGRWAP